MKTLELRELSIEELGAKQIELAEELSRLKFKHATGQLENPIVIRYTRRDIARVKTILNEEKSGRG